MILAKMYAFECLFQSYDTVPDEDQIHLTDSQKLRIAIARAIIRGPAIIVIDELEQEDQVSQSVIPYVVRSVIKSVVSGSVGRSFSQSCHH